MPQFTVVLQGGYSPYWLRGTVWTSEPSRATMYQSIEVAEIAREKVRQFTKPAMFKHSYVHQMIG